MNSKYVKSLLLTAVCSVGASLIAAEQDVQASINITHDAFSVDLQRQETSAANFISQGNELYVAGKYKDAARSYAQAAYIYERLKTNSPHFTEKLANTKQMISRAYYYLAQETALKAHDEANFSDLETAIALCKEAIAIYPPCTKEMNDRIAEYEKMRTAAAKRARLGETQVIPDLTDRQYKIAVLLKQAKLLFYTKQYEQARQRYQEVMLLDEINPDAIQGMRACSMRIADAGYTRYRVVHKQAVAQAASQSQHPVIKSESVDVRRELSMAEIKKNAPAVVDDDTKKIREKLNIVIPRVNFAGDANRAGTPLPVALNYLRQRSKAHDPEGQGVNIFLYYPETDNAAEGAAVAEDGQTDQLGLGLNNPNAQQGADNNEENFDEDYEDTNTQKKVVSEDDKYPQVNMDLVNKPLIEIIKTLAQATNMKYKIEKHAVVLAPKGAPLDDMQIKVFAFDEGMLAAFGGSSDPEQLKENLKLVKGTDVEFPDGAKVLYDPKFRSLIVLNTPDNLKKIDQALLEMRQQDPQPMVQIQAKFVEIEQADLKELGFIQSLSRKDGRPGQPTNGRLQFDENDKTLYDSERNTFTFKTSRDGYDYNLTINAVNQLDSKDVLSSPKVLTNPNKKVSIKMTTERYFEWDYEEGDDDNETSENGYRTSAYIPPWPEFEKLELGITMEVTPKVDKDKRLIMLDVHPWVTTLVGWTEYQIITDDGPAETMTRPIIAERTTDTNVVIADGETVVIGGMIKDHTVTIDDKIPILGDIPLLGNFFKSKSSTVKKTNLLVFITARMIKPDGSPYFQTSDSQGRPSTGGLGDIY